MAEEQDLELDVGDNDEEEGSGSSKLFIIIGAVLVLVIAGAAAFFLLFSGSDEAAQDMDVTTNQRPAIYIPMRPAFVVNYQINAEQYYIQINVSLMTRDDKLTEAIGQHNPLLRSTLVTLFSSQDFTELKTPEGKEALRELALEELNMVLSETVGVEGIEQVLFTSFVMQ